MTKIVSVLQQKGGVGKTTIAVHLAHELCRLHPEKAIVVADADPQGSATKWITRGSAAGRTEIRVMPVAVDGEGRGLKRELAALGADIVVLDLPPAVAAVSLRAALYSNLMLVPVGASALDLEAARAALDVCEEATEADSTKKYLLVPSRVQSSTAAGQELRRVLQQWGPVARASIGLRVAFSDAAAAGQGVTTYAPNSAAHQEIQALAAEVCELANLEESK
jgi:chromosome partitioning protein